MECGRVEGQAHPRTRFRIGDTLMAEITRLPRAEADVLLIGRHIAKESQSRETALGFSTKSMRRSSFWQGNRLPVRRDRISRKASVCFLWATTWSFTARWATGSRCCEFYMDLATSLVSSAQVETRPRAPLTCFLAAGCHGN